MQGYASREAALDILLEQEDTGAFLKDLFASRLEGLPKPDRGLVREICLGVIRNLSLLDYNIGLYAARKPGRGPLRAILRLTAYQIFFLETADFAAVNVGVELAKRRESAHQGGFANAVLKKMAANGLRKMPGETLKALAVNHSHPEWLVRRWHKRLGPKGLFRALDRNNQEAPLWLRVNPVRSTVAEAVAALSALGAETAADADAPLYLRLAGKGGGEAALHSDLFRDGKIAFQDPAAWLIAALADWRTDRTLLDLCSAPGGKAACLAERAGYLGDADSDAVPIVCGDISPRRLARIRDAIDRLGHKRLAPVAMDPAFPALRNRFDLVVVDAPCSNLGVLRRRPEARWNRSPEDLTRLAALQRSLLNSAAALAAPGGCILYATCSPEDEETAEVVAAFLAGHPDWEVDDAAAYLPAWAVKKKFLWLHPGETEYDGFFAARLIRKGEAGKSYP
ncbi:MAG: transcription antitermination factor NusB [Fibrobacteria bacterium]